MTSIESPALPVFERPEDVTRGELSPDEFRALVRRTADRVGEVIAGKVQAAAEGARPMSELEEKVASSTEIHNALKTANETLLRAGRDRLSADVHTAIHDAVMAHIYGLGELEYLWTHPQVENINCNGPHDVHVRFVGGHKVQWASVAASEVDFIDLIRRVARRMGLIEVEFDARHPILDLQLPDGSRLFAVFGGRSGNGVGVAPYLSIRRHRFLNPTEQDLVDWGVWPAEVGRFVITCFAAGENVIVAGDHNAGKTTLFRALALEAISPWERVVTVEASITELGLHNSDKLHDVVSLFSRPPGAEGEGEVSVRDLVVRATRRLDPTRVLVGELLGDEVGPVLDVFSGSTRGSGCTIHARSARSAIRRFEQYGLMANPPLPPEAVRYALAEASPIVVHLTGDESEEGVLRRYCTSVMEITGLEDGHVSATELWGLNEAGDLVPRNAVSIARRERLARRGWNWLIDGWASRLPTNGDTP